jgi:carbon storage regulator
MLILTRRVGETLMVGHEVTVTVMDVSEAWINAAKDIPVHREKIFDRIKQERTDAGR